MFNENVAKMPKTKTFLRKISFCPIIPPQNFFYQETFSETLQLFRPFISSYLIPCSEFTNFVVVRCTERASVL